MANKVWIGRDPTNEGDYGTAANWNPSGVPTNGDNVFFHPGGHAVTGSLNQSSVTLGNVFVCWGFDAPIGYYTGPTPNYLQLDANAVWYSGTGRSFLELRNGGGALDVHIEQAGSYNRTGMSNLYITTDGSSTIGTLSCRAGHVCVGGFGDDPSQTVAHVRSTGRNSTVVIGDVVTATNVHVDAGNVRSESANTHALVEQGGGSFTMYGQGAITALQTAGGTSTLFGGGTVTTATVLGSGRLSAVDGDSRTITTLVMQPGPRGAAQPQASIDPDVTTVTNFTMGNGYPVRMIAESI